MYLFYKETESLQFCLTELYCDTISVTTVHDSALRCKPVDPLS